jgi:hypothetical protein
LIGRLAAPLLEDADAFDPAGGQYSPFGIVYGFVADLLSNMAHARLVGAEVSGLTLEDTFVSRDRLDAKLARAARWAKLPTREGEREHFEHSAEWAQQMFARLTSALDARARKPRDLNASNTRSAQVFVSASTAREVDPGAVAAQDHLVTSDIDRAHANGMMVLPKSQIVRDRQEGRFLASAVVDGHWVGLSKVLLTVLTSRGLDTTLTAVPPPLVNVLRVTCPDLIREP